MGGPEGPSHYTSWGAQRPARRPEGLRVRHVIILPLVLMVLLAGTPAPAQQPASLEHGFRLMYGLQFQAAEREFAGWQNQYPQDPLGPMSLAANVLFAELDRAGILQAQFFVSDSTFTSKKKPAPADPVLRAKFDRALADAEKLARPRLDRDPRDRDALFAMAMVYGLRADYAALIEGRNMSSLSHTREAASFARRLLAVAPDYADAYLATGVSDYIVGSLSAPVRWLLRLAGYSGDKGKGIDQLKVAATRGRLLAPFARILLAVAYLRDDDRFRARELLVDLARDFPTNPLFAREVKRIDEAGN